MSNYITSQICSFLTQSEKEFISYKPFCLVSEISQGTRRTICVALLAGCLSPEQSYDRTHSNTILQIYMFDYSSLTHAEHSLCNYIQRNPNCPGWLHGTGLLIATIVFLTDSEPCIQQNKMPFPFSIWQGLCPFGTISPFLHLRKGQRRSEF